MAGHPVREVAIRLFSEWVEEPVHSKPDVSVSQQKLPAWFGVVTSWRFIGISRHAFPGARSYRQSESATMICGLDTSIVLRLLTGEPRELALRVVNRVMAITRSGGLTVSDLVATESYFALQHHYKLPKAEALSALATLGAGDGIRFSGAAGAVLRTKGLAQANPGFADRLIHARC